VNNKRLLAILLFLVVITLQRPVYTQENQKKITVVCSLEALAGIAQRIGGGYVEVDFIVPEGVDPHDYSLTPGDIEKASRADIIVLANSKFLSLEADLKETILELNASKIFLDFGDYGKYGVTILSVPGIEKNYHGYWLYPDNAVAIAKAIKDSLVAVSPSLADFFDRNLNEFIREIDVMKSKMIETAQELGLIHRGALLAVPATGYIAYSFGMIPKALILKAPGSYASSQEIMYIEEKIENGEIVLALCPDRLRDAKPGQLLEAIRSRTGVPIAYVRVFALGGLKDYLGLLAYNLGVMRTVEVGTDRDHGSEELCLYLGLVMIFTVIISVVEAFVIFRMRKLAEEALYE